MDEYQYKHLKPGRNAERAHCGVTVTPRMIPEGSGVCPVCHEMAVGVIFEAAQDDARAINQVLASVANFGSGLRGYLEGLEDSGNDSPKVAMIVGQFDSTWDKIKDLIDENNKEKE